jgi:hypothetical protein
MNIIQLQDRLKGVPDQALVGYVENPTGEVPTYLALGELQRRKDMRERYQADKQPEPSVAEQLIEETKPQGIAGMTPGMAPPAQGVGAPQPQPEMTPDMIASSGVGALPAGNVGQNYAGGGIVAFADGGYTLDPYGLDPLNVGVLEEQIAEEDYTVKTPNEMTPEEMLRNPLNTADLAKADSLKVVTPTVEVEEEKIVETAPPPAPAPKPEPEVVTEVPQEKSLPDYVAEFKALMGTDEYRTRLGERMSEMDKQLARKEEMAPYMALTEAGLAIAAGESPNAFTNVAAGATRGIKSYTEASKDLEVLRQKRLENLNALAQADRAEELAALQYGKDSQQFAETQQLKQALKNQEMTLSLYELERKHDQAIEIANIVKPESRRKAMEDLRNSGQLEEFDEYYMGRYGKNAKGSEAYEIAKQQFIDIEVAKILTAGQGQLTYLGKE